MAKKKLNSKFYSEYKIKYNRKNKLFEEIKLDNHYLYADGIYPTKITAEDLTDDFVYGRFYRKWGYLSTSGVKDLYYEECRSIPESMKDDVLYISYGGNLNVDAIEKFDFVNYNEDFSVWGYVIKDFISKILNSKEYIDTEVHTKAELINAMINIRLDKIDKLYK